MTRKRISKHLRWAIYIEHGRKCCLCKEPARFDEIEIEHLIPLALTKKEPELSALFKNLELPMDFDLNGIPNLFPAHSKCNSQKSSEILGLPILQLNLRNGFGLEERIKSRVSKLKEEFKRAYFSNYPQFSKARDGSISTRLSLPVTFENIDDKTFHRIDELDNFFDLSVSAPILDLEDKDGSHVEVKSLSSYISAIRNGSIPSCNLMGKMANSYENAIKILLAHKQAQPPLDSYISYPHRGVNDLEYMPVSSLTFGEDGGHEAHPSPAEAVENGYISEHNEFRVDMVSSNKLMYWLPDTHEGRWYQEIARFDFTNSGYEQMLVIEGYFCEGTLSFSDVVIIKCESQDEMYSIERFVPNEFVDILGTPNPSVDYT